MKLIRVRCKDAAKIFTQRDFERLKRVKTAEEESAKSIKYKGFPAFQWGRLTVYYDPKNQTINGNFSGQFEEWEWSFNDLKSEIEMWEE